MNCKKLFGLLLCFVLFFNLVGCKSEKEKQEQMRKEEEARKTAYAKIYEEYDKSIDNIPMSITDKEYLTDIVECRNKYISDTKKFLEENKFNDENISKEIEKHVKSIEDRAKAEKFTLENRLEGVRLPPQHVGEYFSGINKSIPDGDLALITLNDKYGVKISSIERNKTRYKEMTEKRVLKKGQEYTNGNISIKVNRVKHDPYFGETYLSAETNGKKIYRVEFEVSNIKAGDNFKAFGGGTEVPQYILEAKDNDGYVYRIYDTDNTSLTQRGINEGEKAKYVLTFAASGVNPKEMTIKISPYETKTEFVLPVEE